LQADAAPAAAQPPAKKQRMPPLQPSQRRQQQQQQQPTRGAAAAAAAGADPGASAAHKTQFFSMLADQGVRAPSKAGAGVKTVGGSSDKHAAFLADLRLEREMAKKLGMKKVCVCVCVCVCATHTQCVCVCVC
jgi:hypothetical protein